MSKKTYYIYNPDTNNYERVYFSYKEMLLKWVKLSVAALLIGAIFFVIAFYGLSTPTEKSLRRENSELRSQYNILNQRLNSALGIMADLQDRDDNMYRVLLHMEPVNSAQRIAGMNNQDRYKSLQRMNDSKLIVEVSRNMDFLERQLYLQSQSYDRMQQVALDNSDKLRHIPSTMPIDPEKCVLAAGFGNRKSRIDGVTVFHTGWDFAAKDGTAVTAAADGTVTNIERVGKEGYTVELNHGYNYITVYSCLGKIDVAKNSKLKRGDKIGELGMVGSDAATHLHYEVRFKDEPQDPADFCFNDITPLQYKKLKEQAKNASFLMD